MPYFSRSRARYETSLVASSSVPSLLEGVPRGLEVVEVPGVPGLSGEYTVEVSSEDASDKTSLRRPRRRLSLDDGGGRPGVAVRDAGCRVLLSSTKPRAPWPNDSRVISKIAPLSPCYQPPGSDERVDAGARAVIGRTECRTGRPWGCGIPAVFHMVADFDKPLQLPPYASPFHRHWLRA